jgi:hypothetical protein
MSEPLPFRRRAVLALATFAGVLGAVALLGLAARAGERAFDRRASGYEFWDGEYPFGSKDFFNFVLGFRGLIDGLAVASLLTSVGLIIKHRNTVRHCPTLYAWMLLLLLYLYHSWFGLWTFAHLGRTTLSSLVVIGRAAVTFLAVQLLCPSADELAAEKRTDLPAFFASVAQPFLLLAAVAVSLTIAEYQVLPTHNGSATGWVDPLNLIRVSAVALLITFAFQPPSHESDGRITLRPWQPLLPISGLILLVAFIVVAKH